VSSTPPLTPTRQIIPQKSSESPGIHLRSTTPTTIGPQKQEPKPNILQKAMQGVGSVLGYPQALISSAMMQPIGGHSISDELHAYASPKWQQPTRASDKARDATSVAALQRINLFQRAAALEGQSPLDPNLGRPGAQDIAETAHKKQFGAGHTIAKYAERMATDPVVHLLGPASSVLPKAARIGISAAFGTQMAASGVQKIHKSIQSRSQEDFIEGALDLGMAVLAGKHAKKMLAEKPAVPASKTSVKTTAKSGTSVAKGMTTAKEGLPLPERRRLAAGKTTLAAKGIPAEKKTPTPTEVPKAPQKPTAAIVEPARAIPKAQQPPGMVSAGRAIQARARAEEAEAKAKEKTDATKEGVQQRDATGEHKGDDKVGPQARAGSGRSVQPAKEVQKPKEGQVAKPATASEPTPQDHLDSMKERTGRIKETGKEVRKVTGQLQKEVGAAAKIGRKEIADAEVAKPKPTNPGVRPHSPEEAAIAQRNKLNFDALNLFDERRKLEAGPKGRTLEQKKAYREKLADVNARLKKAIADLEALPKGVIITPPEPTKAVLKDKAPKPATKPRVTPASKPGQLPASAKPSWFADPQSAASQVATKPAAPGSNVQVGKTFALVPSHEGKGLTVQVNIPATGAARTAEINRLRDIHDPAPEYVDLSKHVEEAHTAIAGDETPHVGNSKKALAALDKHGIDTEDARSELQNYIDVKRSDFEKGPDGAEEYQDAKEDAWQTFVDTVSGIDASQVENPKYNPKDARWLGKGPQSMHSGIPLSMKGIRKAGAIFGDKPHLTEFSKDRKELMAVGKNESSRIKADLDADRYVPGVTADLTPEDRAKFGGYLLADRMLKVKTELRDTIANGPKTRLILTRKIAAARKDATAAFKTDRAKYAKALATVKTLERSFRNSIRQENLAQADLKQIALERPPNRGTATTFARKADPLSVTLPDGTVHIIKEADIKPFFDRPEIKDAVARHNFGPEAILHRNQRLQGGRSGVSMGLHSGVYFPAEVSERGGNPVGIGSSKGGAHKASASMSPNPNIKPFKGKAQSYNTDYDAVMREAMGNTYSRATEREMNDTLLKEGVFQPYDNKANPLVRYSKENGLEINIKGKWEPGHDFTLQDPRYPVDKDLPNTVVAPTRIYKELAPLYDRQYQSAADKLASRAWSNYIQMFLVKPADMTMHGAALGSRGAYGSARAMHGGTQKGPALPPPPEGIWQTIRGFAAPLQSAINSIRYFNPNLYDEGLRHEALSFGAEAGVLPRNIGAEYYGKSIPEKLTNAAASIAGVHDSSPGDIAIPKVGHNILYGKKGILANAVTNVYKSFNDLGATKTPEGRALMLDAMRETFNTQLPTDQAALSEKLRGIGLGTFYQTGVKNRTAALSAGSHVYAASLAARATFIIAAVKGMTGQNPWDIPGYKWGYVPIHKDKDGRWLFVDFSVADRVGSYPDKILSMFAQNEYDAAKGRINRKHAIANEVAGTFNWLQAPAVSGPTLQIASAAGGTIPYWFANKDISGLELGRSPLERYGYTGKRALGVAAAAAPFSGLLYDAAQEATASQPKDETARMANRILPWIGLPPIRAGQEGRAIMLRVKNQEAAQKRTEEKAAGTYRPKRKKSTMPPGLRGLPSGVGSGP
jgi:hypothetical protein